jgi:hypothetical protein
MLELGAIDLDAGMRVAEQRLRRGFHHTRLAGAGVGPTLHPTFAVIEFRRTRRAVYATSQMDWRDELEDDSRIHDSCDSTDRYGLATRRGTNL